MEQMRCIKCGRLLHDPGSIARGMGPECAGLSGGHRKRYHSRVRSHASPDCVAVGYGGTVAPTLFTLIEAGQYIEEEPLAEEVLLTKSPLTQIRAQFPADLIDLVLSAPAQGTIASHIKNYSKKKKLEGSEPPGKVLQEIRQTCIDLRVSFWPGMFDYQGRPIGCVPCGNDDWKFDNSEKVISRQELESYLARYGMIRLAGC